MKGNARLELPRELMVFFITALSAALGLNIAAALLEEAFPEALWLRTPAAAEATLAASALQFLLQVAVLCFLAPLLEELVFRTFFFKRFFPSLWKVMGRRLDPMDPTSVSRSAWASSLLFGLYHGNLPQGVYAFVMGLFFCAAYERYKGLSSSFALHAACNLVMLFLMRFRIFPHLCTSAWCFSAVAVACAGGYTLLRGRTHPTA